MVLIAILSVVIIVIYTVDYYILKSDISFDTQIISYRYFLSEIVPYRDNPYFRFSKNEFTYTKTVYVHHKDSDTESFPGVLYQFTLFDRMRYNRWYKINILGETKLLISQKSKLLREMVEEDLRDFDREVNDGH